MRASVRWNNLNPERKGEKIKQAELFDCIKVNKLSRRWILDKMEIDQLTFIDDKNVHWVNNN